MEKYLKPKSIYLFIYLPKSVNKNCKKERNTKKNNIKQKGT